MLDCSLCLEFEDVDYTGETVSANVIMASNGDCGEDAEDIDVGLVEGNALRVLLPGKFRQESRSSRNLRHVTPPRSV